MTLASACACLPHAAVSAAEAVPRSFAAPRRACRALAPAVPQSRAVASLRASPALAGRAAPACAGATRRSLLRSRLRPPRGAAVSADEPLGPPRYGPRDAFWEWPGHGQVHYEQAGSAGPALLLLPGFGVSSFHVRAQLDALSKTHRVFAMDFLGQGDSWPYDADAQRLQFSAELWARQVQAFIEGVLGSEPVFIAGNSLGVRALVGRHMCSFCVSRLHLALR